MRNYLAILAALMFAASCSGGDGKDSGDDDDTVGDDDDTDGDDDDDTACDILVSDQYPADGASDAYYRTNVRFYLSEADPSATITVSEVGGGEIAGSTTLVGNTVVWEADATLTPSTDYSSTLTFECGDATSAWSTGSTGAPTGGDLVDRVYDLDLATGSWLLPSPDVGALLATELDVELLFMPTAVSADITMRGALGTGNNEQDVCSPSIEFPAATFDDPFFQIASDLLTLEVAGYSVDIQDLDLSGSFTPNGDGMEGASLQGVIDTRPLVELLSPGGADDAVCQLVAVFGVSCVECGGGEPYCLEVWVDSITAEEVGSDPLLAIDQAAIDANGSCVE